MMWQLLIPGRLATIKSAGSITISVIYVGTLGITTVTISPDTIPPIITLASPTKGLTIGDDNLVVSGKVSDLSSSVYLIVNGNIPVPLLLDTSGHFSQIRLECWK